MATPVAATAASVTARPIRDSPPDPALQAWRDAMIEEVVDCTAAVLLPVLCGVVVDFLLQPHVMTDGLYMWHAAQQSQRGASASSGAGAAAGGDASIPLTGWDCFRFQAPPTSPFAKATAAAAEAHGTPQHQQLSVANIRPQAHSHVAAHGSLSQLCSAMYDPAAYAWNQRQPTGTGTVDIVCNAHGTWTAASYFRVTITWLPDAAAARAALNARAEQRHFPGWGATTLPVVYDPVRPDWGPVCAVHARVSFDGSSVTVGAVTTCDAREPRCAVVAGHNDRPQVDVRDPESARVPVLTYRPLGVEREYTFVQKN